MQPVLSCPQRGDYERLIHGDLSPGDVERLSQHLAGCSPCAVTVQTLLAQDTLLSTLRGATVDAPVGTKIPAKLTRQLLALRLSSDPSPSLPTLDPPRTADEIGRLAHYRVLKVLGEGGMGVVFLAEDTRLGRTVALKTMKPEIAADPRHRQRFLREARAAAKVEHDHIVPIYGVGEDNGVAWLAMPFLKGQSLGELLKRWKVLEPAHATRLSIQVAKGLEAAHAAGLIHRDVKPANIWVGPEDGGRVKLLDFGLARDDRERGDQLTRTGAVLGTPAFMSPEQANGEALDARADLFSLGCVLYCMVTGRLPFHGHGMMDMLRALVIETPPHPHEVNPDVPGPLSALIMSLLAKDRSARPPSAAAVVKALEALQERPTSTLPMSSSVTTAPPVNPWVGIDATEPLPAASGIASAPRDKPLGALTQPRSAKRRWLIAAVVLFVLFGGLLLG